MLLFERRWVAGHVLALTMAALFVGLGFWQLARNSQKHEASSRALAAYSAPAPDVTKITAGTADGSRVEARGTFDADNEAVLRNQVRNDRVGVDVLTPLHLDDGTFVLVDRGWVQASASGGLTTDPPPKAPVVVRGLLHSSNTLAPDDTVDRLADGRIAVPRVDVTAIGRAIDAPLRPVWIEAQSIEPEPTGNAPALPRPPAPDSVNHMQYAIEWFAFALIPLVGWPIVLRRQARQRKAPTSSQTASPASTNPVASCNGRRGTRDKSP